MAVIPLAVIVYVPFKFERSVLWLSEHLLVLSKIWILFNVVVLSHSNTEFQKEYRSPYLYAHFTKIFQLGREASLWSSEFKFWK